MTVPTVFISRPPVPGETLVLDAQQYHYLVRVVRVRVEEPLRVSDGAGHAAAARVVAVEPARVVVRVHEPLPWPRQEPQLTVVAGALKHRAMQLLVAKAAELGVDRLVLCGMRRCVARLAEDRQEHLVAVAREAARQVGRQTVPEVALCPSLDVALARLQGVQLYFLWERGGASFRDLRLDPEAGCVCVVGPEGGFAEEEVELLLSRGALPLSLDGPALKAETAALAGMVLFLFLAGRFC